MGKSGSLEMATFDEFLFAFHCNHGRILYRFRNKTSYSSNNANFSYPLLFNLHGDLEHPSNFFSKNLT